MTDKKLKKTVDKSLSFALIFFGVCGDDYRDGGSGLGYLAVESRLTDPYGKIKETRWMERRKKNHLPGEIAQAIKYI